MATVVYGDFEWDADKATANKARHGVSFEEASTVFADPCYVLRPDETHPDHFWALGLSALGRDCGQRRAWAARSSSPHPETPILPSAPTPLSPPEPPR
ncbi:BrnT family toxin [Candidatus Binatia bacterium]|nr:BrnT family toxin [Candidatus Binatia bacterium]